MSIPEQLPADIVSCIIEQATSDEPSLSKLVRLSHINSVFAESCRSVVSTRVRSVIRAFMDDGVIDSLFETLENVHGFIGGSVALAVIEPGFFIDHPPRDIDIMTPSGTMTEWVAWCDSHGFVDRETGEVNPDREDSTKSILWVRMHNGTELKIHQSQSSSALLTLLSSNLTSQMNAISPFRIYCFYPWMTVNGISISCQGSPTTYDIDQLERRSIEYYWSTCLWNGPCGRGCPMIWHLSYGLEGVGTYEWSRRAHLSYDIFAETHLRWGIGDDCYNVHCPYRVQEID
ncbi:uncharacterized protein LACBIDRAFT_297607 [Laccaria bicolor S238N-H82]|uniref:Predicted protein n=1 Tax=Laccaria bicolor (strain S238N-H82 / ATCC MYA-4686) TaxID=486041 RepID=B0DBL0_LACBS|nr:uncharacterized protein LACBIDRAFT_297607 [Laccaria bicolor S238N-H82]EDR08017.1 predicted protein [Laccaria bicolor S238N-H82]|eukprot:XP_001881087.1 predicted protein [Laccaria bicolor S238N-H82]